MTPVHFQALADEAAAKNKSDSDAADDAIAQGQRELDEAAVRLAGCSRRRRSPDQAPSGAVTGHDVGLDTLV